MPVVIQRRTCKEKIHQDLEEELRVIPKTKAKSKGQRLRRMVDIENQDTKEIRPGAPEVQ